jgi:hypothetical protein
MKFHFSNLFQGTKTQKIDEEEVKLIRKTLSVYEVSAIQCHLKFQERIIAVSISFNYCL